MFSGLVLGRGRVIGDPQPQAGGGLELAVSYPVDLAARLGVGASVAVSGVCLTVVDRRAESVTLELSAETLAKTTLGGLAAGSEVNLEPALRLGDPLGGHWVQGHIDGTTTVTGDRVAGEYREMTFALAPDLRGLVVEKGSITVDGVSLTVAGIERDSFRVALIPHTLAVTTLGGLAVGDRVNLEVDVLGKYVQQALLARGLG